jgi:hypothetical protein
VTLIPGSRTVAIPSVSGCERVNLFFASQLVPFISRPYRRHIVFKNRVRLVWCEGVLQRVVPALSKTSLLSHPPLLRKPRSEVLEKFHYARTLLMPGNAKFFSRSHDWGDSRLRRSGKCDRDARAHWPVQRVVKITFFIEPDVSKQNEMKSLYLACRRSAF